MNEREGRALSSHIVDIGLPAYGKSPYIRESIDSVLAQTYRDWRLVISANGHDASAIYEQVKPYLDDERIAYSPTGTLLPPGANFMRASEGSAPYVAIIHDDDRWHPGWLETRVKALADEPRCAFAFGECYVIDGEGRVTARSHCGLKPGVQHSATFLPFLYEHNVVPITGPLVRRAAYEAGGAMYTELTFRDHELWLRLASRAPVVYLAAWDSEYRIHSSQTSWDGRLKAGTDRLLLVEEVEPWIPVSRTLKRKVRANAHLFCALDAIERRDRAEAFRQLKRGLRSGMPLVHSRELAVRAGVALTALVAGDMGRKILSRRRFERWQRHGESA
jgi:glycosyltransferase involved in cell wall biosynthesis